MCVWKPSANTLPSLGENLHSSKYLYHLQFILIDFGIYKFPIKQNFSNIFLFHPPKQPATVHGTIFQAIYSFMSVSHYSSISSSTLWKKNCLKCTTNDRRSIFKIALLTSEICLIMTWICKNHFDKFPHFYMLSFLCSSAPKDTDSWIFFPRIFFFSCQQHWQSNLNEILHTDIFLTRENSTKWIGTEKGVLTPIIGRFVCD